MAAVNREFQELLEQQCSGLQIPLEIHTGRTHEILELATVCIAVSGSVGLELLYHAVPSAISYHVHPVGWLSTVALKKVPWISLVNLLAKKAVLPEFMSFRCQSEGIASQLNEWLSCPDKATAVREQLRSLSRQYAVPGACMHAAEYIARNLQSRNNPVSHHRISISQRPSSPSPVRLAATNEWALSPASSSLPEEPT
jgi:lipid-A-disaccharide synthase